MKKLVSAIVIITMINSCVLNSNEADRNEKSERVECAEASSIDHKLSFPVPKIKFNPRSYICYKTKEDITVNGDLSEESWQDVEWSDKFVDIEGDKEPLQSTRFKMLWNNEFLFIGAELMEPHINAQLTQRDTVIFYDNDFEVFIDPDGDTHNYFEMELNAFNTVWDLLLTKPYRDNGLAINGWNISGLKSAIQYYGTINNPEDIDEKWTIEIAIPIKILSEGGAGEPKEHDIWRINFSRVQWQYEIVDGAYKKRINPDTGKPFPEYNWVWSPQGIINMHYPEMWGFLQFAPEKEENNNIVFVLGIEEKLKWELRKVYYYQRSYFNDFNSYAKLSELEGIGYKANEGNTKISVKTTSNMWEAIIEKNGLKWSINHLGKTKKIN